MAVSDPPGLSWGQSGSGKKDRGTNWPSPWGPPTAFPWGPALDALPSPVFWHPTLCPSRHSLRPSCSSSGVIPSHPPLKSCLPHFPLLPPGHSNLVYWVEEMFLSADTEHSLKPAHHLSLGFCFGVGWARRRWNLESQSNGPEENVHRKRRSALWDMTLPLPRLWHWGITILVLEFYSILSPTFWERGKKTKEDTPLWGHLRKEVWQGHMKGQGTGSFRNPQVNMAMCTYAVSLGRRARNKHRTAFTDRNI